MWKALVKSTFSRCLTQDKTTFLLACCLVSLAACSDIAAPGLLELTRNRALWDSQGLHSYTLNRTDSCFCQYSGQLVAVRVENDAIASVQLVSTGEKINQFAQTVSEIFDEVRSLLEGGGVDVRVQYEESLGFPTRIEINCPPNVLDCGGLTTIRMVPELLGA